MITLDNWWFMISAVEAVVLGLVQGLTEWLPVSSSGHLAVAVDVFGLEKPPVLFFVLLHVGTLLVIAAFFRETIFKVFKAVVERDFGSAEGKLGLFVLVGSVPTAVLGYVLQDVFKALFGNLFVVGAALLVTGVLLFFSQRGGDSKTLSYLDVLLVGTVQGLSIIPGVSRSGATISTALLRGVDREAAFKFSFLLSVPAVLGALVMEAGDLDLLVGGGDVALVALGVAVSMVVGYLSLKILLKAVLSKKLYWFTFYCWIAGVLIIFSQTILK